MVRAAVEGNDVLPVLDHLLGGQGHVDGEAVASGALPAGLAGPAAADLVQSTGGVRYLVAGESQDEGCNVVGLEGLDELLGQDGSRHGRAGVGGNGVDVDVVLEALKSESAGEAENSAFLSRQVSIQLNQKGLC